MTFEPYICIKGPRAGDLDSFKQLPVKGAKNEIHWEGVWQPYADFEREKLHKMEDCGGVIRVGGRFGYSLLVTNFKDKEIDYHSSHLISYSGTDYLKDSESSRLLKRAEFLKAVCEKEGVGWLPIEIEKTEKEVLQTM